MNVVDPVWTVVAQGLGVLVLAVFVVGVWRLRGEERAVRGAGGRWVEAARFGVDAMIFLLLLLVAIAMFTLPAGDTRVTARGLAFGSAGIELRAESPDSPGTFISYESEGFTELNRRNFAKEFGRGAEVDERGGATSLRLLVPAPGTLLWAATFALFVLFYGSLLAFLVALRTLLARASRGDPFARRSVSSLRVMAAALVLATIGVGIVEHRIGEALIEVAGGTASLTRDLNLDVAVWAVLLLALAEVWRYGARLQEESEATV